MAVKEKQAEKDEDKKKKAKTDEAKHHDAEQSKAKDDGDDAEKSKGKGKAKATKTGPSLGGKVFRAFVFTFLATFLTAFLFADPIPNGLRVDFDLLASVKLALISGVIAAVLRAAAGALPIFADD